MIRTYITKTLALVLTVGALAVSPLAALASDLSPQRDPRFLMPGEIPGGATTVPTGNYYAPTTITQGTRDFRFLTSEEFSSGIYGGSAQGTRDARFLTPGQMPGGGTSGNGVRITGEAKIANCKEWVNVRPDPSTRNKPLGKAYLGATLNVLYWDSTGTWAYTRYNGYGETGWISGQFIRR